MKKAPQGAFFFLGEFREQKNELLAFYPEPNNLAAIVLDIITDAASLGDLLLGDELSVEGSKLDLLSFFSVIGGPVDNFPIVTP